MKIIGMIPSRLDSQRLPKKALMKICGIPLIAHVIQRAKLSTILDELYLVTDSEDIANVGKACNCKIIMTSPNHETGSDRLGEAVIDLDAEIIVNIQGDEALVRPEDIDRSAKILMKKKDIEVSMLATKYTKKNISSDIKVSLNSKNEIIHFSRSDISTQLNEASLKAYHLVSFRKNMLLKFCELDQTEGEILESIEYMRLIENEYKIGCEIIDSSAISVDTPEDLRLVDKMMKEDNLFPLYKDNLVQA
jgi:3-deoxy-manno-octulosonate cytidylyltransferase (CMP-KDO synthetase)